MEIINNEIPKFIESITKRVYPLTEKEKTCINAYGKLIIKRGHLKKAIIETISKYDQQTEANLLEETGTDKTPYHSEVQG